MAESFRDQAILITGASDGIGRELALQLATEGARLVLAGRNPEKLRHVAQACTARGGRAVAVPADVAERDDCRKLIDAAVEAHGSLHALIHCAGVSMFARFAAVRDLEMLEYILRVNYLGPMYCTGYALPHLRRTQGRIVAIASLLGKIHGPGSTGYVASKHALKGFFDSLRPELRRDRVSVTMAYPGFVRTEIYKRFLDAEWRFGPDMTDRIPACAVTPVERCARRIIEAARRRRREVPPTLMERLFLALNWFPPRLVDLFWQRPLRRRLPLPDGSRPMEEAPLPRVVS